MVAPTRVWHFFLTLGGRIWRPRLLVLGACFAALAASFGPAAPAAEAVHKKPNLVLIMADDLGYECMTANGGQSYQTPVLDRLAATGMRFRGCHVQPLCTPTRAQLMTGIYNVRNYIHFGLLDPQATTFGHLLKRADYRTGIAGKWQLSGGTEAPQHFGFDEALLWQQTRRPPRYANPGLEINGVEKDYSKGEYGPTLVNQFALDFIARHKEEPFFLYYPMILTHAPYQPTPDSSDWDPEAQGEKVHQDVKHFGEMVTYMDKMIGRLVDRLDQLGLRDNTLVLFLGDNGTGQGVTTRFEGTDYRGGKGTTTARGTHVPLVANWPGRIKPGQVNSDLVDSTDFLPTLCEAAGVEVPAELKIDGHSFLPQMLGRPGSAREWVYCWYARDGGPTAQESAMDASYKVYRDGRVFDLTADPFEEHVVKASSLSGAAAEHVRRLQAVLDRYAEARPEALRKSGPKADDASDEGGLSKQAKRAKKAAKKGGKQGAKQ